MSMEYGGMECTPMQVKDYLQYLKDFGQETEEQSDKPCLYLKVLFCQIFRE